MGSTDEEEFQWGFFGIGMVSLTLQIVIIISIKIYNLKKNKVGSQTQGVYSKAQMLVEIESYTVLSKCTMLIFVVVLAVNTCIHLFVKFVSSYRPDSLPALFSYTLYLNIYSLFTALYLICKNEVMRKCIVREVKELDLKNLMFPKKDAGHE